MNAAPPIPCVWTGEHFAPLGAHRRVAARHYGEGEIVSLVGHEERSEASHRHYFACVREAWQNLNDDQLQEFPTAEHLRKKLLIKAGYRDETSLPCSSKAEALRVAAFLRPVDDFAIVVTTGSVVTRFTAKSQSQRAMGKSDFQASKDAVLDLAAQLIGATPQQIEESARTAA